jgi:L-aminopeptidase/D-esterase-like protein
MTRYNAITDISGIRVGHAHDPDALTGCTVVLCEGGVIGGVDQRGGAPGTRQIDSLYPMRLVDELHAILLSGGSAFGLDAAGGVVRYLEEKGVGLDVRVAQLVDHSQKETWALVVEQRLEKSWVWSRP